ncbi:MAG TPA: hypothetical protein VLE44_03460 [Candidatus Saccharimonadales bacterium]|nr:hypothetical protein [Candidatus Saccharimonadales bacterium]
MNKQKIKTTSVAIIAIVIFLFVIILAAISYRIGYRSGVVNATATFFSRLSPASIDELRAR